MALAVDWIFASFHGATLLPERPSFICGGAGQQAGGDPDAHQTRTVRQTTQLVQAVHPSPVLHR